MDYIIQSLSSLILMFGPFFLMLGVLVFVHEAGHFLTAKFFGVRVEIFSLGFGKTVFQKQKGDTSYRVSLIPLGGYVKMFGDDPTKEIPDEEKKYSFLHQPLIPRMLIVLAGPLVNFFFAIILFAGIVSLGERKYYPVIGDVQIGTAAAEAGFKFRDKVLSVNGAEVNTWSEVVKNIQQRPNSKVTFEVLRNNEKKTLQANVAIGQNPNPIEWEQQVGILEGLTTLARTTLVGVSNPDSLGFKAGMPSFSVIKSINGKEVEFLRELAPLLRGLSGQDLLIKYSSIDPEANAEIKETKTASITGWVTTGSVSDVQILEAFGFEIPDLYLFKVKSGSPADKAGLKHGDRIVSIDGAELNKWEDLLKTVSSFKPESNFLNFKVLREGKIVTLNITPEMTSHLNSRAQDENRYTVGIMPAVQYNGVADTFMQRDLNPFTALWEGTQRTIRWTGLTAIGIVRLIKGELSTKSISGIISIGSVASKTFQIGWEAFLKMMAILSINLGLLNLLPIPVLDGGHLVFFTLEALRGQPISLRKLEIAQTLGFVILMSLMAFALFNDVNRLYSEWGW